MRSDEKYREVLGKGVKHLKFGFQLYEKQIAELRYFLHEHADQSSSWSWDFVKRLKSQDGIEHVTGVQCRYPRKALDAGSTTIVL